MVNIFKNNNYLVVKITIKEANLDKAEEFKQEVMKAIDEGNRYLIINFEDVEYIDSTFMAALVSLLKYAIAKNGDIAVAELKKDIYYLFHMIRMDKVFMIYDHLPDTFSGSFGR